jgi:hypothetical protein
MLLHRPDFTQKQKGKKAITSSGLQQGSARVVLLFIS